MGLDSLLQQITTSMRSKTSPTDLLNNSPLDIGNKLGSTSQEFTGSSAKDQTLGGTASEVSAKSAGADASYTTTQQGVTGQQQFAAFKPQVSFVTSTDQKSIDNPELAAVEKSIDVKAFSSAEMAKLKSVTGEESPTKDSTYNWFGDVQKMNGTYIGPAEDGLKSEDGTLLSGAKSLGAKTIDTVSTLSSPQKMNQLTQDNLDMLPPNVRSTVGGIVGRTSGQLAVRTQMVTGKASAVYNVGKGVSDLLGMGEYYPEAVGSDGRPIKGFSGKDADFKTIDGLYRDARALCSNVDGNYSEFGASKDAYDLLLRSASESGCAKLLDQIANCDKYYDQRSGNIAYTGSKLGAYRGDPYTVNATQRMTGRNGTYNPRYLGRTTAANMDYDNDGDEFDTYLSNNGMTRKSLFQDEYGPDDTYDARHISAISANNKKFVDDSIGSDTSNIGVKLLSLFG